MKDGNQRGELIGGVRSCAPLAERLQQERQSQIVLTRLAQAITFPEQGAPPLAQPTERPGAFRRLMLQARGSQIAAFSALLARTRAQLGEGLQVLATAA